MIKCKKIIFTLLQIRDSRSKLRESINNFSVSQSKSNFGHEQKISALKEIYDLRIELDNQLAIAERETYDLYVEATNYIAVTGEPLKESGPPIIETNIEVDFNSVIKKSKKFYRKHKIVLENNFEARARDIWIRNYEDIKKEIATYGYDYVLIVPDSLPPLETLHNQMTRGYDKTELGAMFELEGSFTFSRVKDSKSRNNFHLLLLHDDINSSNQVLIDRTYEKCPINLVFDKDLTRREKNHAMEALIMSQGDVKINFPLENITFGDSREVKNSVIRAEGLTLKEYLIFQRQIFESTGKHLDDGQFCWILASAIKDHLLIVDWNEYRNSFEISADPVSRNYTDAGYRFCRSFT
jgi:hypothetical protein